MNEQNQIILNARKWAKKGLDNAPLARYYQRYTDLNEGTTFSEFIALVHLSSDSKVTSIDRYRKAEVKPAMNIEVLMNLLEEQYSRQRPAMD